MFRADIIKILKTYKEQSADKYGIIDMGLFGSVARDEAKSDSDVDVAIKVKVPNPFIMVHIKEDIEEKLHLPVDIVRLRKSMNPLLKKRIEADIIYV